MLTFDTQVHISYIEVAPPHAVRIPEIKDDHLAAMPVFAIAEHPCAKDMQLHGINRYLWPIAWAPRQP